MTQPLLNRLLETDPSKISIHFHEHESHIKIKPHLFEVPDDGVDKRIEVRLGAEDLCAGATFSEDGRVSIDAHAAANSFAQKTKEDYLALFGNNEVDPENLRYCSTSCLKNVLPNEEDRRKICMLTHGILKNSRASA